MITMMAAALALAGGTVAAPASAQDDVNVASLRTQMHGTFNRMANLCARWGFTRAPELSADEADRRIYAQLLLNGSADAQFTRWIGLMTGVDGNAGVNQRRMEDAIAATAADPSRYAEGERLFISAFRDIMEGQVAVCRRIAADPFINRNYLSGTGSLEVGMPEFDAQQRERFRASVAGWRDGRN